MGNERRFTEEDFETKLGDYKEEAKSMIEDEDKFERFVQRLENKLKLIPAIGKYLSDITCLVSLVRSNIKKEYTDVPLGTILTIVAALIYIITPFDLIPDFIPGVGYLDDMALLVYVLKSIHDDVEEYKKWRVENNKQINR